MATRNKRKSLTLNNKKPFDKVFIENNMAEQIELMHNDLLEALFFFWDAFERAQLNFFLVKDTARQIIASSELKGKRLTLGIRRMEWNGGGERVFNAFLEHEKILPKEKTDDKISFVFKNIPVTLYIYDDNPCLDSLDIVFYGYETFNTPNPFNVFSEKYDFYE